MVTALVAILAGTTISVLQPQNFFKSANDSKRKNDLKQLQNALESYRLDKGTYPLNDSTWHPIADLSAILTPTYIAKIPSDPISDGNWPNTGNVVGSTVTNFGYSYYSPSVTCGTYSIGAWYALNTGLQDTTDKQTIQYADPVWCDGAHINTDTNWAPYNEYVRFSP